MSLTREVLESVGMAGPQAEQIAQKHHGNMQMDGIGTVIRTGMNNQRSNNSRSEYEERLEAKEGRDNQQEAQEWQPDF